MTKHSSVVGGSTCGRLIECPGSYQATLALPASIDLSSEYALEGTAMHHVMDAILRERQMRETATLGTIPIGKHKKPAFSPYKYAETLIGQTFGDRVLTREHVDTMISPALDHLENLEGGYGGGFTVVGVELRVTFPGVPGAFGTCDLVLQSDTHVLHVDWKFGQGVGVLAAYKDDLGEKLNPQLLFYMIAAVDTLKKQRVYGRRKKVIAIIQPRSDTPLTHAIASNTDAKWFTEDLQNALLTALDRDPPRKRGEHCRFAPCKVNCPKWTGPLLDLAAMGVTDKPLAPTEIVATPSPYGEYLAKAKELVDILGMFGKEVNDQLHAYLEDGGAVPGWRLKAKVKMRQWIDDTTVEAALERLGFMQHEIWQSKLQTFGSTDATAKKLGVKIPADLRVAPESTETTIARTDDPAPVVNRQLAVEQFAAALAHLSRKG